MSEPKAFIIGHPIAHTRSPLIHGHWLAVHGLAGRYQPVDLRPEDVADFVRGFPERGYRGGNVTVPHKERVFTLVDHATDRARRLGAVNTLWFKDGRIHGDNTDIGGFVAHLEAKLGTARLDRVGTAIVLGAGGAARGVVAGLLDRGVREVLVANRTLGRAKALMAFDPARVRVLAWADLDAAMPRAGLLVNTTSLGMAGQPALDIHLAGLPGDAAVADIVYVPLETPLLAAARRRGLATIDGLGMLLHQAVPGFAHWFGVTPLVTPELAALVLADIARPRP